ncbi:hypothetical protein EMCG_02128 [[Emmonsia] crescens]|uniref:Uncharacterized protein n=1 Tax=[Emmonsia] crescens TaxID=73230 RepID=A0A0G2J995_9EURO|nr:hypothetical protein EMCG_02128 [Emmonsia crescens UAMH 3008]
MKITTVALLGLVSFALAKTKTPTEDAAWDYCGLNYACYSDEECQYDPLCRERALDGDPEYIGCGPDIFDPHTCWTWVKPLPKK